MVAPGVEKTGGAVVSRHLSVTVVYLPLIETVAPEIGAEVPLPADLSGQREVWRRWVIESKRERLI